MPVIAFLNYPDFIRELETEHPTAPVRVQHFSDRYGQAGTFLRTIDYKIECAFSNDVDTFLVRFPLAKLYVYDCPTDDQLQQMEEIFNKSYQAVALITRHLQELGYDVRPGLLAETDTAKAVADIATLYSYLNIDPTTHQPTNQPATQQTNQPPNKPTNHPTEVQ